MEDKETAVPNIVSKEDGLSLPQNAKFRRSGEAIVSDSGRLTHAHKTGYRIDISTRNSYPVIAE